MNPFTLAKTIAQNYFMLSKRAVSFGEPVRWTDAEAQQFLANLHNNPLMLNRFAIAANNKTGKIIHHYNLEKHIFCKNKFTIDSYYRLIHLDYLEDYIKWGDIVYRYADYMRAVLEPMKQSFRITIPLKLKDGHYHWVLMEAYPLQLDINNNMISHLNIYTVLSRFSAREKIPLVGDMWDNNAQQKDWTDDLWKKVNQHRSFILTPEQSKIVHVLNENIQLSNLEISQKLNKTKNTIDVQNKQIIARARDSFGNQNFNTIKDVVQFLKERDFFQEQFFKEEDYNGNNFS